jgi:hypothetical protein
MSTTEPATIKPATIRESYHGDLISTFCNELTTLGVWVLMMLESNIRAREEKTEDRGQTVRWGEVCVAWFHRVDKMAGRLNELAEKISDQLHERKSDPRALIHEIQTTISAVYRGATGMLGRRLNWHDPDVQERYRSQISEPLAKLGDHLESLRGSARQGAASQRKHRQTLPRKLTGKQLEAVQAFGECECNYSHTAKKLGLCINATRDRIKAAYKKLCERVPRKAQTRSLPADHRGGVSVAAGPKPELQGHGEDLSRHDRRLDGQWLQWLVK